MDFNLEQDYKEVRARKYPNIGDQLDEIWKILNSINNTLTPAQKLSVGLDSSPIFDTIKRVKTNYKKRNPQE